MVEIHGEEWEDKPVSTPCPLRKGFVYVSRELRCRLLSLQRDLLQWLLDEARAKSTPFDNVVEKVLLVNFGAIHTSSGVRTPLPHSQILCLTRTLTIT